MTGREFARHAVDFMTMTPGGQWLRRMAGRLVRWLGAALVGWAVAVVVLGSVALDRGASAVVRPIRRELLASVGQLVPGAEPLDVEVAPGLMLRGMLVRA